MSTNLCFAISSPTDPLRVAQRPSRGPARGHGEDGMQSVRKPGSDRGLDAEEQRSSERRTVGFRFVAGHPARGPALGRTIPVLGG